MDIIAAVSDTTGRWEKIEAAVDSGSTDNVVNPSKIPHLKIMETNESKRGETWTYAGGKTLQRKGEVILHWVANESKKKERR